MVQTFLPSVHLIYKLQTNLVFYDLTYWIPEAMEGASSLGCLAIFAILGYVSSLKESRRIDCQEMSTLGFDYVGEANTTVDGIPCQRWSDTWPHNHSFTHLGDHNFCRNPIGARFQSQVWCYTTDPEHERRNCSVPFCPSLKAIDFSPDNDGKPDENNSYTHASLKKKNLPPSFTICTALGMFDTLPDSIQCLNSAKKWFIQYSIQYCFTQDSI